MDDADVLEHLQELGLTEYQSRGYLAAVRLGNARPSDLAEESGVPRARIYDVIDDLGRLGFVDVRERSGGKEVTAPPPEVVLEQFRKRKVTKLSETVESTVSELERVHDPTEASTGFVSMVGLRESAIRHIKQAISGADWWLSMAVPLELYLDVADEVESAVDRGVNVRLVLPSEDAETADLTDLPDWMEVRHRALADTLIAADRTYGVFSSRSPRTEEEPFIATQVENLVFLFQNYFEQFWTGSARLQTVETFPRRYLDPWRVLKDLADDIDAGADFSVRVEGYHTGDQRTGTWEGPLVDYELSSPDPADYRVVLPVKAALFLDIDGQRTEVGGRKAVLAPIAADGLEVDAV